MILCLKDPNSDRVLYPGDIINLSRFDMTSWKVNYGWYEYGGNRPFCGWYLTNLNNLSEIELFLLNDFDDVYSDEERFVPDNPVKPDTSVIEITENGTYDVSAKATAIVNVEAKLPSNYGKITYNGYVLTVS